MLPVVSTATSRGLYSGAVVASTLSSINVVPPFPATVVITPVLTVTFLTRLLAVSAMIMLPDVSSAMPSG